MNRRGFFKNLAAAATIAAIPAFVGAPPYIPLSGSTFNEIYMLDHLAWLNTWTVKTERGTYYYQRVTDTQYKDIPLSMQKFYEEDMERSFSRDIQA